MSEERKEFDEILAAIHGQDEYNTAVLMQEREKALKDERGA